MSRAFIGKTTRGMLSAFIAASALLFGACAAATRPPDTAQPRAGGPPYPVVLAASDDRRAGVLANWKTVAGEEAATTPGTLPQLQPVTATLAALPANLSSPPRMPAVIIKDEKQQSEEETRESLRRFIATAAPLLGVTPGELSLVEVKDAPVGGTVKTARYRQNPFPYPLRNGYGDVEITFTTDLRVVGLSSTAIPDTERLRLALAAFKPAALPTADKAIAALANTPVTFTDRAGKRQTRTITQSDAVAARELVVFPLRRTTDAAMLELHLAWEIAVGGPEAPSFVYLDAVTGEQLAADVGS